MCIKNVSVNLVAQGTTKFRRIGTSEKARRIYSNLTLSLPPGVFVRHEKRHQNDDARLKMNAKRRSVSIYKVSVTSRVFSFKLRGHHSVSLF